MKDAITNLVIWLNEKKLYGIIWLLCWAVCLLICFGTASAVDTNEQEYKSSNLEIQAYQDEMRGRMDAIEKDVAEIKGGMQILLQVYAK